MTCELSYCAMHKKSLQPTAKASAELDVRFFAGKLNEALDIAQRDIPDSNSDSVAIPQSCFGRRRGKVPIQLSAL
jgi:hypothetical protein